MDLLLESFLEECYGHLTGDQQTAFACLLDETDADILDWVKGNKQPGDPAYQGLIETLQTRMKR